MSSHKLRFWASMHTFLSLSLPPSCLIDLISLLIFLFCKIKSKNLFLTLYHHHHQNNNNKKMRIKLNRQRGTNEMREHEKSSSSSLRTKWINHINDAVRELRRCFMKFIVFLLWLFQQWEATYTRDIFHIHIRE